MATIRIFTEDDIPGVAALFARVYPEIPRPDPGAFESYVQEMLFDNPWRDPELPSRVAEEDGHVIGFDAVIPRPMQFRGRAIRVAVRCQFMVDPDWRHRLASFELVRACLSGPQDLTLSDGSTARAMRLWVGIGGAAPPLYSLHWIRPLRPARYALSLVQGRTGLPVVPAAGPLAAVADALAARSGPNRFLRARTELTEGALDAATMLAQLPEVLSGNALQPLYEARSLEWLLDEAGRKTRFGSLRARAVRDGERLIGWYMYYVRKGGVSEVVQLAAVEGSYDRVLQRLLADAWGQGAAALRGRVEPRYVQELSSRHCWFRWDSTWTLVHSRDPELMAAIHRGEAFLGRLEGEWWLRFLDG